MTTEVTRRQQIEDAASTLFRERGYAATSVRDIAQSLDMQGGSLYAHVASKEDVLWSIVVRAADRFNSEVGPIVEAEGRPAKSTLQAMIGAHVRVVTSAQKDAAVFLHEWRFLNPERRAQIGQRRDNYEGLFRQVIAQGIKSGEFQPVDPRLTAMAILSALNGIATWYRADGPLTAEDIADQHASLFLGGLANNEPNFIMRSFG